MGIYNVVNPGSMVAGQPEDVSVVLANFNALAGIINGNIEDVNISPTAAIQASKIAGLATMSPGSIMFTAASATPSGWLPCDGSAVSRATYAALFSAISTTYGAGDGSTTFNLPDLLGRMIVGLYGAGQAAVNALGKNEGVAAGNRRPQHRTSSTLAVSEPGHRHAASNDAGGNNNFVVWDAANSGVNGGTDPANGSGTRWAIAPNANNTQTRIANAGVSLSGGVGTGVGTDSLDCAPFLVLNAIIKT